MFGRNSNNEKDKFTIEEINEIFPTLRKSQILKIYEITSSTSKKEEKTVGWLEDIKKLPWNKYKKETKNYKDIRKKLDETHYGLAKVKDTIIRHFITNKYRKEAIPKTICLVGSPGIGKSTIAKSIAKALNREFTNLSFGGISDPESLKGYDYIYRGSCPGLLMTCYRNLKTSNPVFLLDEIDKCRGNVHHILSEILDYSQNDKFLDKYVRIPFDLSKTLFIATVNDISMLPDFLVNRMEMIYLDDYSVKEKKEIVKQYLIPSITKEFNLKSKITFDEDVINKICYEFCDDYGVRKLKETVEEIIGNILYEIEYKKIPKNKDINITLKNIEKYKKTRISFYDKNYEVNEAKVEGFIYGMGVLGSKGTLLKFEATKAKGQFSIEATGNLGNMLKESISVAKNFIISNGDKVGLNIENLENKDSKNRVFVHLVESSIPKNGTSAGLALTLLTIETLKNKGIRQNVAITGEVSLSGSVYPVGGVKEKILGGYKQGMREFVVPFDNIKEATKTKEEIKEIYNEDIVVKGVKSVIEAYNFINNIEIEKEKKELNVG